MQLPEVKLDQGIHVMHLFYRVDREKWGTFGREASQRIRQDLEALMRANPGPSCPRVVSYANVGGKADLAFLLTAEDLVKLGHLHRDLERCFPAGTLNQVYSYLSVTELPEYVTTEGDVRKMLTEQEQLEPGSAEFDKRFNEVWERTKKYQHYRLYPELPDWEVMAFYPMSKRRSGEENWYRLDFDTRKELMGGHAKVGRKFAGRVTQLITGSTGIDDWEWGVTLVAHQIDALKEIVYEMRFDEVSARYGEFGPFYINLRLDPAPLWEHLRL